MQSDEHVTVRISFQFTAETLALLEWQERAFAALQKGEEPPPPPIRSLQDHEQQQQIVCTEKETLRIPIAPGAVRRLRRGHRG